MIFKIRVFLVILLIVVLYIIGPLPVSPKLSKTLPEIQAQGIMLDSFVIQKESSHKIKSDNEARIVWNNDSTKEKTPVSIVYLHGFSASQEEGNPIHRNIAKKFGCNLYLSRLAEHGLDTVDQMKNFTVDRYWESVKEAYAIGKELGSEVLLIGTSTGGTVNILLAANFPEVKGIINISPNIRINDPNAWILNNPWGLQIARMVMNGDNRIIEGESEAFKKYWYTKFRLESVVELEELLEFTMDKKTFSKVQKPALNLYYYKNENEQDKIVKVDAIKEMHEMLGTPPSQKVLKAMPTVGDHVMGSPIKSKDVATTENEIERFCIDVLKMRKI